MMAKEKTPAPFQRNALAPGLVAAVTLFLAPLLLESWWFTIVLFLASILAIIVAWFAIQARHWWWVPVFAAIAVVWNPVLPLPLTGPFWVAAQPAAAVVFLVAGALIRTERT